jgi:hypothetical protein
MSLYRLLVLYIQAADLKLICQERIVQSKVVLRIRASALLVISGYNPR